MVGNKIRGRTESVRQMLCKKSDVDLTPDIEEHWRPKHRSECINGPRPCPYVGCRHNLYLDVDKYNGSIKYNFPLLQPWEMPRDNSCSLDVADDGDHILEDVGDLMNISRERIRQLQAGASFKARRSKLKFFID
ncbi:MAG: hypothetical protein ACXABY_11265 [Candidatus Thorarchaeota archaeon]